MASKTPSLPIMAVSIAKPLLSSTTQESMPREGVNLMDALATVRAHAPAQPAGGAIRKALRSAWLMPVV